MPSTIHQEMLFMFMVHGWKASAFICHKLSLAVSGAARSIGVAVSQYIDDRHVGQLFTDRSSSGDSRSIFPASPGSSLHGLFLAH